MILEINSKSLCDSCDVFIYYKKFADKELFVDLINLNKLIKNENGKIDSTNLIGNSNFFELFKNLYFAGRCSFENKFIPLSELKNELSLKTMFDINFYNKMYEFIGGILPDQNDKKKV